MNQLEIRSLYEHLLAAPDDAIDVSRVALVIAAEDLPSLDVDEWMQRLDALGDELLSSLGARTTDVAKLAHLNAKFFHEWRYGGEGCRFDDPNSSFLPAVVERHTGLPIALSMLYVHVARRMGLRADGVGFPGHFMAKVELPSGDIFVDAFRRLPSLTSADMEERHRESARGRDSFDRSLLAAAPPRQVVARMLRNLKNLHMKHGDLPRAFSAVDRLLVAQPDAIDEVRDRGLLCALLGANDAARRDLAHYLDRHPRASDAGAIRKRLERLKTARTLLN